MAGVPNVGILRRLLGNDHHWLAHFAEQLHPVYRPLLRPRGAHGLRKLPVPNFLSKPEHHHPVARASFGHPEEKGTFGGELILGLGVVYHGSMTSWKWIAVPALAFLAGPALADSAGKARVVIDQRSGTVVITENVRVGTVAVMVGGLVIRTRETPEVSHPGPFARAGETVVVPRTRTRIRIEEGRGRRLVILPANSTLRQLVNRLNALGLGPRDLIRALQAIKLSGALQAEIVVR